MNISIDLKRNPKRRSFHKAPNVGAKYTKAIAMKDIVEECGENRFFTKNYVNIEANLLKELELDFIYIPL